MDKKKLSKWVIGVIVLGLVIFLIFRITSRREIEGEVIQVKAGDIATYYNFSGSIEAKNKNTIYAELPIQISEFLVEEGEQVEKDQLLYKTTAGEEVKANISGGNLQNRSRRRCSNKSRNRNNGNS